MHAKSARSGFTILEAAVALAIIGMVCVGVLGAWGTGLRTDTTAAAKLPLAAIAEERLAAVDLEPGALEALPDSVTHGTVQSALGAVAFTASARRVGQIAGLYDVTIRVTLNGDAYVLETRRYRRRISGGTA